MSYQYTSPFSPPVTALREISLDIQSEEILAIAGASGSGKTTLIQHFNGLLQPTEGRILVNRQNLSSSDTDLQKVRQKIGMAFQFPETQLFEETVYSDVAFGMRSLGFSDNEIERRVNQSLEWVGLDSAHFRHRSPFHLSGGEQRRVAIAGILAIEPEILVLDEPTVGLDRRAALQIERIIHRYHKLGRTVIFVSHNMDLVARLASNVVVLLNGRIIYNGSKEQLFQSESILSQSNLTLPQICQFMQTVQNRGYSVKTNIYSIKDAKKELIKAFGS